MKVIYVLEVKQDSFEWDIYGVYESFESAKKKAYELKDDINAFHITEYDVLK